MSALDQPWLHDLVTVLSAPTVVLSEPSGQIRDGRNAEGVLHADVRVLSREVLTVGGAEPAPLGSGLAGARSAWFGDDHRDEVRSLGSQRLRRLERPVSGRGDHRLDPLAGLRADQVRCVDHVGDSLQRHGGGLGDVGHRRTLCWHLDPL